MKGVIYIFGSEVVGAPFKVGATSNPAARLSQHRTNASTIQKLNLSIDPATCGYLSLWESPHESTPNGVESEILRDLKRFRLSSGGSLTEWIDIPLDNLRQRIRSNPWMERFRELPVSEWPDCLSQQFPEIRGLRLSSELANAIDNWRRSQADLPGRPEAIRRLVEQALDSQPKKKA